MSNLGNRNMTGHGRAETLRRVCSLAGFVMAFVPVYLSVPDAKELFSVDVKAQEIALEKDFGKASAHLNRNELQNARSVLALVSNRIARLKKGLSKEKKLEYSRRLSQIQSIMTAKEDSLVNRNIEILKTDGIEAAEQFMQNDLRIHGLPQDRMAQIDKVMMDLGPELQRMEEEQQLRRTIDQLEKGLPLDKDIDPYILHSAKRILEARADSIRAIDEQRARVEADLVAKRRLVAAKARQDSLNTYAKEQKRLAKEEAKRQEKLARENEKARRDSIKAFNVEKERLARLHEEQEKAREDSIRGYQQEKERIALEKRKQQEELARQREQARQDSIRSYNQEQERIARAREAREQARQDSIRACNVEQERLALEARQRQEQRDRQLEQARQDSIRSVEAEQARLAKLERERKQQIALEQDQRKKEALRLEQEKLKTEQARLERERQAQLAAQVKAREEQRRAEAARLKQENKEKDKRKREEQLAAQRVEDERQKRIDAEQTRQREEERISQENAARARQSELETQRDAALRLKREEENRRRETARATRIEQDRLHRQQEAAAREQEFARHQEDARRFEEQKSQAEKQRHSRLRETSKPAQVASVDTDQQKRMEQEQRQREAALRAEEELRRRQSQPAMRPAAPSAPSRGNARASTGEPAGAQGSTVRAYYAELDNNRKTAREYTTRIYTLVEEGKAQEAAGKFRQHRVFISQNIIAEAFNVLEQTVGDAVIRATMVTGQSGNSAPAIVSAAPAAPPEAPEEVMVRKIREFIRRNNVEGAYAELQRTKKDLKRYLGKQEFRSLEDMVKNAYEYRTKGK